MTTNSTKFKETEIGPIPEEWSVVNIGDALNIIDGDRGTNYPSGSDFLSGNYCVFLNAKNVCGDSFDFSNCQFISQAKDLELRKGKMQRGDFVLTTRGTVGNIAFYDESVPFENMRINSGMVILRNGKDFDSKYLFQLLKSWIMKKQITELTTGSAQPQLPIRDLNYLKLIKPTLPEQHQIAEILSSLDDKIELNRKINANLEKLASTLFKKWFVDIGDKLPKGWRVGQIKEICKTITNGGTPRRLESRYWENGNIPWIKTGELADTFIFDSEEKITNIGLDNSATKLLPINSVIIAIYAAPTVGRLGILKIQATTNQACTALVADEKKASYILIYYYLLFAREYLNSVSNGAAQQNISKAIVEELEVKIPPSEYVKKYSPIIESVWNQIENNERENINLSLIRDSLLPRLMSGKIRTKI